MSRTFENVRQGVKDVSAKWLRESRALKKEDQVYGKRITEDGEKEKRGIFNSEMTCLRAQEKYNKIVKLYYAVTTMFRALNIT